MSSSARPVRVAFEAKEVGRKTKRKEKLLAVALRLARADPISSGRKLLVCYALMVGLRTDLVDVKYCSVLF